MFKAKGNKGARNELGHWSENIATKGRETQKKFISYCIELFRQALLKNYKADSLLFFESRDAKFSLEKFAPFIHQNNIFEITSDMAPDGKEGISFAMLKSYDFICLDFKMPNMNGIEFINHLRQEAPQIPVAVVTGSPVR